MTADLPGIPSGRIDREPLDYPTPGVYPAAAEREAILRTVLADAGVELGASTSGSSAGSRRPPTGQRSPSSRAGLCGLGVARPTPRKPAETMPSHPREWDDGNPRQTTPHLPRRLRTQAHKPAVTPTPHGPRLLAQTPRPATPHRQPGKRPNPRPDRHRPTAHAADLVVTLTTHRRNPMTDHNPLTEQQLDEYEALIQRGTLSPADRTRLAATLVAEVRRLRAVLDRTRALALLEGANFLRDAHFRDGMTVQEIGTALRNTADRADPMVGSLARDGFGHDEITDILARPVVPAVAETSETNA